MFLIFIVDKIRIDLFCDKTICLLRRHKKRKLIHQLYEILVKLVTKIDQFKQITITYHVSHSKNTCKVTHFLICFGLSSLGNSIYLDVDVMIFFPFLNFYFLSLH